MNKQELREEIRNMLKGMYWESRDPGRYLDAIDVEADNLMEKIEQYAQQGSQEASE